MKNILVYLLTLSFVACSNSSSGGKKGDAEIVPLLIPGKLDVSINKNLTPLTKEQKKEVSLLLKSNENMVSGSDILPHLDDRDDQVQDRMENYNKSSPEKKAIWDRVKSDCVITPVKEERSKAPSEVIKTGDVITSNSKGSINGPNCPIDYLTDTTWTAKYQEIGTVKKKTIVTVLSEAKVKESIKDGVSPQSLIRGLEMNFNTNATFENMGYNNKSYTQTSASGYIVTNDGNIDLKMNSQNLYSNVDHKYIDETLTTEVYSLTFKVVSQVYTKNVDGKIEKKFYINSEEMSEEEYSAILPNSSSPE